MNLLTDVSEISEFKVGYTPKRISIPIISIEILKLLNNSRLSLRRRGDSQ